MNELVQGIQRLNTLVKESKGMVDFNDLANIAKSLVGKNIVIVDIKGVFLECAWANDEICMAVASKEIDGKFLQGVVAKEIMNYTETVANILNDEWGCLFDDGMCIWKDRYITVVPIIGSGIRRGFLLAIGREKLTENEIVLLESIAVWTGMAFSAYEYKKTEVESRKKAAVQMALSSLSYSEQEAMEHIFKALNGTEGLLVASKVADSAGITRSVIVNALRKLESAGLIESRSLGMKGTHIRIINEYIKDSILG